jgi:hypothetical protein
VDEVGRKNAAGLHGQELLPGWTRAAGRWADPGIMQDPPHRGCRERVAEFHEFALHPPVPHVGFSVAIRITRFLIAAAVDGRPERRRFV